MNLIKSTKFVEFSQLFIHRNHRIRLHIVGGTADGILPCATNLIAELCAFRELSNSSKRPIIFICHGFGGILLKRALVFSSASQGD
jgi:hypothetical protein